MPPSVDAVLKNIKTCSRQQSKSLRRLQGLDFRRFEHPQSSYLTAHHFRRCSAQFISRDIEIDVNYLRRCC